MVENTNQVGLLNGAQPVRHRNGGPMPGREFQRFLDERLGLRVQSRRGLVEKQDARVSQEGPGDLDSLLLSAA